MPAIRTSFRNKLLLLIVALISLTLLATMLAVLRATNASVESLVREELQVAQRVFLALLEDDREQLRHRGELLAGDFAFKKAIATGDQATIVSVLANHGDRIAADLVLLLSSEHEVLLSTHDVEGVSPRLKSALSANSRASVDLLTVVDHEPYQLVMVPVWAPDLIGWVGLGLDIDREMLANLRKITSADITLVYTNEGQVYQRSTLHPSMLSEEGSGDDVQRAMDHAVRSLRRENWLSNTVTMLERSDKKLYAILSSSLDKALASYQPLRLQMVLVALAALVLATITSLMVARWVTRPIYRLLGAASQIADGNYTRQIRGESDEEFNKLASALNFMRDTVAERESRIRHQAQHDILTQLPNRNYIYSLFTRHTAESPAGAQYGLGLLELSNLGQLTDLYGSEFSDTVLQSVAQRVTLGLRRGDLAARVADKQILLFFDDMNHSGVEKVVTKLRADLAAPIEVRGVPVRVEPTTGFVLCPQHGTEFDDVLRRAQIALTQARSSNREFAVYQVGQDENHLRQIQLANRLQVAVRERAFTVQYQPKYELESRRVNQVEALMRWTDAELGAVYPDEFIPLAEQTGIITQISDIVVDMVLEQLKEWRNRGLELSVSINLSGVDILQRDFILRTVGMLQQSGLPSDAIIMEITETAMVADMGLAMDNIALFERAGIQLSIDDFGTGFSSLAQLKSLPVQELKIDKSLILQLDTDRDDQLIVRSTIEMAHYLGLKVVAEGVENEHILQLLNEMGCDSVQGYHLSRPMSSEQLELWLAEPPSHVVLIPELLDEIA